MSNKLALTEVMALGQALAESKYFSDAKEASQVVVKILAGQELGVGPIAAMSGINIIKGKAEISGNILASLVKSSAKYDYRVKKNDGESCVVAFFENDEIIGESEFTVDHAKQAKLIGKDTYKSFPRNMLFNRAMSNGVKWFCPDVTNGQAVYTPGEIQEDEPVPDLGLVFDNENAGLNIEEERTAANKHELAAGIPNAGEVVQDIARQKWIEAVMAAENYPDDAAPLEKAAYINKQMEDRELEFAPVMVPEVLSWG